MDNLLQFTKSSGCGCKIDNAILQQILSGRGSNTIPSIFKSKSNEDASLLDLGNGTTLLSTIDFFSPLINDPYYFGAIAAANSLSDIYAMGGKPVQAIAILGWPVSILSAETASLVIEGANSICLQAGITISGGHSIESAEPFFGLSVNGLVNNNNLKFNSNAKPGDDIYITKPIGLGILSAAAKKEIITESDRKLFLDISTKLNNIGEELGKLSYVSSITDITGFGFCGHLTEMLLSSGLSAEINKSKIPVIDCAVNLSRQFVYPDITTKNFNNYKQYFKGMDGLDFLIYCDPQTNGGLIFTAESNYQKEIGKLLISNGIYSNCLNPIGKIVLSENKETMVTLI